MSTNTGNTNPAVESGWVGWMAFAGVMLAINGLFSAIQGLIALIGPNEYYVATAGSLWLLDVNGWGWWNLIIGIFVVLVALALLAGQTWARVVAIVLVILSALGQLVLVAAQPWWSLIVIAVDVVVVYALTVHGHELRSNR